MAQVTRSPYNGNTSIVWAPDVATLNSRGFKLDLDWDDKYTPAFVEAANKLFSETSEAPT